MSGPFVGNSGKPAVAMAAPAPAAAPLGGPLPPVPGIEPAGAVKSPMVGTAYLGAQPGGTPFAAVGDVVREGQTLFIIEAMKVMNQIPAPRAGRIVEILVADATPVEFGQVLAVLE